MAFQRDNSAIAIIQIINTDIIDVNGHQESVAVGVENRGIETINEKAWVVQR